MFRESLTVNGFVAGATWVVEKYLEPGFETFLRSELSKQLELVIIFVEVN